MKMNLVAAIAALFSYTKSTNYGFTLNRALVFDYNPADAEALFQKLQPFFTFQSDHFAPPRLEYIGWGAYERYEGMSYDGENTLSFVRDYLPTPEEVAAYAALCDLVDLDVARQRLSDCQSWRIYLRFPQEKGFYRFCERLVPLCNNP